MRIRISFFAVLSVALLYLIYGEELIIILLAALMHELGHIFVAQMRGIKFCGIRFGTMGVRLAVRGEIGSYWDEILLALGGPAANLLTAGGIYILTARLGGQGTLSASLAAASITLGVFNLLPIEELDGGRIAFCLLSLHSDAGRAQRACRLLSLCLLFFLWTMSGYLFLTNSSSGLFFLFSLFTIGKIFDSEENRD